MFSPGERRGWRTQPTINIFIPQPLESLRFTKNQKKRDCGDACPFPAFSLYCIPGHDRYGMGGTGDILPRRSGADETWGGNGTEARPPGLRRAIPETVPETDRARCRSVGETKQGV